MGTNSLRGNEEYGRTLLMGMNEIWEWREMGTNSEYGVEGGVSGIVRNGIPQ